MVHGIISTLSIAAFGLLAARAGNLLRLPTFRRRSCDDAQAGSSVWNFNAGARTIPKDVAQRPAPRNMLIN
jgi:hypothetical protein